jgi:hypothetical protein
MESLLNDEQTGLYGQIWALYFKSHVQQLAYSTIVTEILKGELEWVKERSGSNVSKLSKLNGKDLIVEDHWIQFVRDFILHLHLFGYVVYRLIPKGRGSKTPGYEIALPSAHMLYKDAKTSSWKLRATNTAAGARYKGTKLWNMSVMSPPIQYDLKGKSINQMTSAGYRAIPDVQQLLLIQEGFKKRDSVNSTPTVYTQVSKAIVSAGEGKRPWFKPASLPQYENSNAPDMPQDFNAIVEDRAEAIQRLDDISERARARTRDMYDADSSDRYTVGAGTFKKQKRIDHRELIISDGRDAQPVPYLRAPEHVQQRIDDHTHRIMFAWGVPPQVLGQNINSERTAASNRLSDMAISGFDAQIKLIRHYLKDALQKLTILISKDPSVYIHVAPCMNAYSLTQLEGILTPDACADAYSCVYQIPHQFIDQEAIKQRQLTLNDSSASKNRVEQESASAVGQSGSKAEGSSSSNTKNRPEMSQAQKDQRSIAKSKKPSE